MDQSSQKLLFLRSDQDHQFGGKIQKMCGRGEPGDHSDRWVGIIRLQFIEAMMRFYKEINEITTEKVETKIRMMSKASKMSINSPKYMYAPQKISKQDFQNLGKTSKKFGHSQAYQYSDKASNQLNGKDKES